MPWDVEYTEEFGQWWDGLDEDAQISVDAVVRLLERFGPALPFPHSSRVRGGRTRHLRELRVQHQGRPLRVLYAFDPRRVALLLLGGDKGGSRRWYADNVPMADEIYARHVESMGNGVEDHGETLS